MNPRVERKAIVLKTSVERLEGSNVKLTVTVPVEEVDRHIDATYKELAKKYRFPGFRPGKAPRPILDQNLGREYILTEATESVVNTSYPKALDSAELRPVEAPELEELETVEPGKEYTYFAEITVRPELTLTSTDDVEIALPPREATQEEIDVQLEIARERFASLEPVEDRGIEADDYVLLSFVGTVDGEPYEGNEVDKYMYEMNRGLMPAEFDEGLLGAKPGDERHIEFEIPETSSNPDFVGKTAAFDVTVHEIKAKMYPEVDDEFAANLGFDTAEELIADLRNRIDLQKGTAHSQLKERRLRDALAKRLEGEIPEQMVVSRQGQMMRDFMNMLENRDMTIDQYLQGSGVDMEGFEADIKQQAEQSVREELALEALFRAKGMEITDPDIEEEIASFGAASGSTPEDARKRWEDLGLMSVVREQIAHRKAVLWLIDNAKVTEEAPETAAATEGTKKSAPKKAAAKKASAKNKSEAQSEETGEAAGEPAAEKTEE